MVRLLGAERPWQYIHFTKQPLCENAAAATATTLQPEEHPA
jgi:hypothetical protein